MDDKFLEVAKQAALEAAKVISKISKQKYKLFIKTDRADFATPADLEAEKIIVNILRQNFPDHNIIAEEKTRIDQNSKYTWAIDPIDGTISFAQDLPFFAISIGLIKNHEPILGVIYHVATKDMYWAKRGQGAYLNNKGISVSKTRNLSDAAVGLGVGTVTRRRQKLDDYFFPLLAKVKYIYMLGGGAVSLAYLAKGSLDAVPNNAWIWDQAAAAVIITEAGGKVTDREGKDVDWFSDRAEFIATNGLIHEQVLEVLK